MEVWRFGVGYLRWQIEISCLFHGQLMKRSDVGTLGAQFLCSIILGTNSKIGKWRLLASSKKIRRKRIKMKFSEGHSQPSKTFF